MTTLGIRVYPIYVEVYKDFVVKQIYSVKDKMKVCRRSLIPSGLTLEDYDCRRLGWIFGCNDIVHVVGQNIYCRESSVFTTWVSACRIGRYLERSRLPQGSQFAL